jgi:hypothetical protein
LRRRLPDDNAENDARDISILEERYECNKCLDYSSLKALGEDNEIIVGDNLLQLLYGLNKSLYETLNILRLNCVTTTTVICDTHPLYLASLYPTAILVGSLH